MKVLRSLALRALATLWLCIVAAAPATAATYSFRSDTYSWESTTTTLSWARLCTQYPGDDDQATITFSGGFTFSFGGTSYSSVRVLANGVLQFGADTGFMRNYADAGLPAGTATSYGGCAAGATVRTMMGYWTDLNPSANGSGGVTWQQKGTAPNRYVVISWNGVFEYSTNTPYSFQIILYENGEFKYQYGNANATGSNATIGVQLSSADYTLYSYNSGYNANGTAIRWYLGNTSPTRVAEYRFDEFSYSGTTGEVRDSSGNGLNGISVGSASTVSTGYVCRGLGIAANTSSAAVAVDTFVNPASALGNSGGFSFWYRSAVAWNNGTPAMIADARTASSGSFFVMRDNNGAMRFVVTDSNGTRLDAKTANQGTSANTWVHVAVSWRLANGSNQSSARIYLNGTLAATALGTTNGTLDPALGSLYFGDNRINSTSQSATLNSANGTLDSLRLYNFEIGVSEIAADMAATHSCSPPVDHYELALPASSLACLPTTVTVTACANASSPCTSPATTLNGATATLSTSGATLGSTTVTFNASGVATTTLSHPAAANGSTVPVTLAGESIAAANPRQCCPNGTSCAVANNCSTTFNTAGFIFTTNANAAAASIPSQTAGTSSTPYYLRAVRTNTTTQACETALSGTTTVNWAYQCHNPSTCSAGNLMSVNGGSPTAIAGNPNTGVSSYTPVSMTFDANGNAPFTFTFNDVGQATLWVTKTVNAAPLAGSSNAFVTKPAGFTVSNIRQTAAPNLANPGATGPGGSKFVRAGEAFSATVTAVTSGGATTPNYGRENSPEGVALAHSLVLPSGGTAGTLANGTIAGSSFSSGAATVSTLSFSEVGVITLTPAVADGDYLGAGNVSGPGTGNVGRFHPARFALSGGAVTHRSGLACSPASAFTYLGENFRLGFTLTAQNTAGATTRNYAGAYAKLDPSSAAAWNLAGVAGGTVFSVANGRLALGSAGGAFTDGVASAVTLTAQVPRGTLPEGPYDTAAFGIAPVDSDGVALAAFDLDADTTVAGNDRARVATVPLRFGRLRLLNAMGAADRALAMPVLAESWTGSTFDINALDNCTTLPTTSFSFGNLRRSLTSTDTTAAAAVVLNGGRGTLRLNAPGGGRSGSFDVAASLGSTATDVSCLQPWTPPTGDAASSGANLAHLRGAWCGAAWDKDPAARATFGLPRGHPAWVYRRENP